MCWDSIIEDNGAADQKKGKEWIQQVFPLQDGREF
jgi:hypothetical protein